MMSSMMSTDVFYEMPEDAGLYKDQYDVKAGRWPKNYHECVLVLDCRTASISDFMPVHAGTAVTSRELEEMVRSSLRHEEDGRDADRGWMATTYDEILGNDVPTGEQRPTIMSMIVRL